VAGVVERELLSETNMLAASVSSKDRPSLPPPLLPAIKVPPPILRDRCNPDSAVGVLLLVL
jgi:hypothetical protein